MLGKTDVEHIQHLRLCLQKRRNLHRVVLDPVHADSERLDAANEHEGIKRGEITADRLVNQAELFREVLPVRRGADKPGERVIVALQIFCPAVDDEVRTECDRALIIGGEEGIVHDEQQMVLLTEGLHGAQIRHLHGGVARRLDVQRLCLRADERLHLTAIGGVRVGEGQPARALRRVKQPDGAAIQIVGCNDVVSGIKERQDHIDRRHAGGAGKRRARAFE